MTSPDSSSPAPATGTAAEREADPASPEALLESWRTRLVEHRQRARREPMFNPIHQLGFEISGELESGALTLRGLADAAKALCDEALLARADRLRDYLALEEGGDERAILERIRAQVEATALDAGGTVRPFEAFAEAWVRPYDGVVFTAHPTFAMSQALRGLLVDLVEGARPRGEVERALKTQPHRPDKPITLDSEHEQALAALAQAQDALAAVVRLVLETARRHYPERWRELAPAPVSLATWVGYDLDGRNDITWVDTVRFRLQEKHWQLQRYAARLEALGLDGDLDCAPALALLRDEAAEVERQISGFEDDLESAEALARAANALTREHEGGLGNAAGPLLDELDRLVDKAEAAGRGEAAVGLATLRAEVRLHGLGAGLVHLRINAAQVHNAIRKPLGLAPSSELESRVLLDQLDGRIEALKPETVNFASLALESATAIRQFIAIAQILKHIDGDKPIRMLIAECEQPFTALAALYFARLFGVEEKVDISPLFETEQALEHGAAIVDSLLKTRSYAAYVRRRGRLAIQTGFSDAGRFIGQIPAALAVERLHGQLARVLDAAREHADLGDIEVLIYDTHGESMGRGSHPAGFRQRIDYVLSPWVRRRYRDRRLPLLHETSFQGGDGFVLFGRPRLALATLANLLAARDEGTPEDVDDPFYDAYLFGRDMHERLRAFQTDLFADADHAAMLTAFGTNLLVTSGSRKTSRQFDGRGDNRIAAASLRAIPHNALLQQMGFTINVVSGLGTAVRHEREAFETLHASSDRLKLLVEMVRRARAASSLDTLAAYATLFDGAYWVTRPLDDRERSRRDGCLLLAERLREDPRHHAMLRLISALREDAIHLDDLLRALGAPEPPANGGPEEGGPDPALLHAMRIALIQHVFLLAARLPRFSTRNDISQDDVMDLVTRLRVVEATRLLRSIFPQRQPLAADYRLDEPASYLGAETVDYAEMNRQLIDPMLTAYEIAQDITLGVSHCFGAYG